MNFEELEEALDELLPPGYTIETNKHGQIIVLTNLKKDEDDELHAITDDEIDGDFDPDFDSLEDEDDDD
jgi:hypothetical protein